MSKQSEAKERQEYVDKLIPCVCSNCMHYRSRFENVPTLTGETYRSETDLRCGLGGFKVKKMGSCKEWSGR